MLIMMRKKRRRLEKKGKCSHVKAMKKALCRGVRILHSPIQHLNANISYEKTEYAKLGGTGVAPQVQPPPRMYSHPPPWMSYTPPYITKQIG